MLKIATLISIFISLNAVASTNGGGVLIKNSMMRLGIEDKAIVDDTHALSIPAPREIIFNMGQEDGSIKFAYGQLLNRSWRIQKLEMTEAEIAIDPALMRALQDSKSLNSWTEIR